jgi:hypothetical protein
MLWTIWVERINLTFNNNRWEAKKTQQIIWQGIHEYARIAWDISYKEPNKATIYDDALGN